MRREGYHAFNLSVLFESLIVAENVALFYLFAVAEVEFGAERRYHNRRSCRGRAECRGLPHCRQSIRSEGNIVAPAPIHAFLPVIQNSYL